MKLPSSCPHCGVYLDIDDSYAYFLNLYKDEQEATKRAFVFDSTMPKGEKLNRLTAIYDWDKDRTSHFECPDCKGRIERTHDH